jgi:adenine C2-methylase RlmN of 23S rRNA A2503 and tRNA A37
LSGTDHNLAWLTRGEGVLNLRAMAGIGEPALNYMNATGRLPTANDNGALVAAIDRQTDAVERQTRVIMATG